MKAPTLLLLLLYIANAATAQQAYFAGATDTAQVKKQTLLAAKGLVCKTNGKIVEGEKVLTYTLTVTKGEKALTTDCIDHYLCEKARSLVNELEKGDTLHFSKIVVSKPEGTTRMVDDVVIEVL